jgi:hypothetical protein
MQITTFSEGRWRQFSTEDVIAFVDFVRDSLAITDQRHLRSLFEVTCKEVGSLGVGFTARSSRLAIALGEELLGEHESSSPQGTTSQAVIESLSRKFHSHAYPVNRKEAKEIGLNINEERDSTLEALMWELWLDLERELKERQQFHPISELLNSPAAATLLSPVPQLDLPANALGPHVQAELNGFTSTAAVPPVDYETVDAIMESPRLGHRGITKGKILASRLPDLNLQFNVLVSFRGWEQTHST